MASRRSHSSPAAGVLAVVLGVTGASAATLAGPTPAPTLDALVAKSQELWRDVRDKDVDAFRRLATDDFVNVDWTGLTSKTDLAAAIPDYDSFTFELDRFKLARVDRLSAVVLYHVVFHASYHGKQPGPTDFNATDVWAFRNGDWHVVLHTETAVTGAL